MNPRLPHLHRHPSREQDQVVRAHLDVLQGVVRHEDDRAAPIGNALIGAVGVQTIAPEGAAVR